MDDPAPVDWATGDSLGRKMLPEDHQKYWLDVRSNPRQSYHPSQLPFIDPKIFRVKNIPHRAHAFFQIRG